MPQHTKIALKELVEEYSRRNKADEAIPVYSVTNSEGFCVDYFSKDVFSQNLTTYKIVPRGCFAYNPSRINVGSVDWQNREERVIVSPLYVVFSVAERLDCRYLLYFLKSPIGLTQIKAFAVGSVRDILKFSALQKIEIPLPPLAKQAKIVAILDAVSATLQKRRNQLDELDALVRARFVEMFGDMRQKSFKTVLLKTVSQISAGQGAPQNFSEYTNEGIPFIKAANLQNLVEGFSEENCCLKVSEKIAKQYKLKLFKKNSLVFAKSGMSCLKGRVHILTQNSYLVNHLCCVALNEDVLFPCFLKFFWTKKTLATLAKDDSYPSISLSDVGLLEIPLPSFALQEKFAAYVARVERAKEAVRSGIAETRTLFDALTAEYFG